MTGLRKLVAGGAMALPMLLALPAAATTLEATGFKALVQGADALVVGSVVGERTETRDGQVFTITEFDVSDVAFGSVSGTVSVATPGGLVNRGMFPVVEVVPGAPRFLSGQSYMLVLDAAPTTRGRSAPRLDGPGLGGTGLGGPVFRGPQIQRGGAEFTAAGLFQGVLALRDGQVDLPDIGSDMDVEAAFKAVSELRAAPLAPSGDMLSGETK